MVTCSGSISAGSPAPANSCPPCDPRSTTARTRAPSLVVTAPRDPAAPPRISVSGAAPAGAAVDDLIRRLGVPPATDDRHDGTHRTVKRWLAGDEIPDGRFASRTA
ncbi:hypothetical protein GCM10025331_44950 [Actinoplanes utahensis]|uniref:hypothetical protein n=1 Tax=Actinoplanes utahensis TaxID=1869 RepID=UPI001A58CC45|nr:hypothetical protein Aut01nite_29640 [Actinoplanes utahensis]